MRFSDRKQWWTHGKLRVTRHEGVDFCCYTDQKNEIVWFNEKTKVPTLYDGLICEVFDDFLGKSVLIRHSTVNRGLQFCSIYSHIEPDLAIKIGHHVAAGQCVGRCSSGKTVPVHLHLTVLWFPASVEAKDWPSLVRLSEYFVNPISYIRR